MNWLLNYYKLICVFNKIKMITAKEKREIALKKIREFEYGYDSLLERNKMELEEMKWGWYNPQKIELYLSSANNKIKKVIRSSLPQKIRTD